jgi:hypothetical protein
VIPDPPEGLSAGLRPLYEEAAAIADASPASASALLRMLLLALLKSRGMRGRDLVRDVGTLVEQGAPVGLLRALDVIAMSESESRKPAELSLANGHSDAQNLFMFINLFVDQVPHG